MLRNSIVVLSIVFLIVVLLPVSSLGSSDWQDHPGTVEYTLNLPDHQQVTLDGMMVDRVIGDYVFVKDPWAGSPVLPVFTNAQVKPGWTIEIQGYTLTVSGTRIVVAQQVRLYLDSHGESLPPFPLKYSSEPINWPYMLVVPSTSITSGDSQIPTPAGPSTYPSAPVTSETAPEGTVAAAKINENNNSSDTAVVQSSSVGTTLSSNPPQLQTGTIQLIDKVVTAVFYTPNTQTVTSFYIQEPTTGGNGIKVVPQTSVPAPVEPGNIVTVTGRVVASDTTTAECYISASKVDCSGSTTLPNPVGTQGRSVAGGAYGRQQALYLKTEDQSANPPRSAAVGSGLTLVGTRIRLWGSVTWVSADSTVCFIDDGSGFKSNYSDAERSGIRIIFPQEQPTTYQVGDYITGITGVLGAELSEDTTPQPVPVIRIARAKAGTSRIWYVKQTGSDTSNTGLSWSSPFATIQKAIRSASTADEVWVASGTYSNISLISDLNVYGGFSGSETMREQRNWRIHPTLITTNLGACNVNIPETASNCRIDGFWICNGNARYGKNGGGISCDGSSIVIANNNVSGNNATKYGGGIYASGSNVIVWNNDISNNKVYTDYPQGSTYAGGGIYTTGASEYIVSNRIDNNNVTVASNMGGNAHGAGIYCSGNNSVVFGNAITNNSMYIGSGGARGCGVYVAGTSSSILNNLIKGSTFGSAVYASATNCLIANNVICDSDSGGIYVYNGTSQLINNTIVSCGDYGVETQCSSAGSALLKDNIIAYNSIGILMFYGTGIPTADYNCVYNPSGSNYSNLSAGSHDINVDPQFINLSRFDLHIRPDSPCLDTGINISDQQNWRDIDGDSRIFGSNVDLGADESCAGKTLLLSPITTISATSSAVTLVAQLYRGSNQTLSGYQIDFDLSAGSITSISPGGNITSATSGYGITGSDGRVSVTITTPSERQQVALNASTSIASDPLNAQSLIDLSPYKVGFAYSLAVHSVAQYIDRFLQLIDNKYWDVSYQPISDISTDIDSSYNVVFIAVPSRTLTTSELTTLSQFVNSSKNKRIVLVGEYSSAWSTYNGYLNTVAQALQISLRFSTAKDVYDQGYGYHCCPINTSHYLMAGVTSLWAAATDTFVSGWNAYARPLAYIYSSPTLPWILEEDTATAGSIIAVHDSNLLSLAYDDYYDGYDSSMDQNFKFIYNLCTIFPQ